MSLTYPTKRKIIWKILTKENGISITPQSSSILLERPITEETELVKYLRDIGELCKGENVDVLTDSILQTFVEIIQAKSRNFNSKTTTQTENALISTIPSIEILTAEKVLPFSWNSNVGRFLCNEQNKSLLHSTEDKIEFLSSRFSLVKHNCSMHLNKDLTLSINSLFGSDRNSSRPIKIVGAIQFGNRGQLILEDLDSILELKLTESMIINGVFTQGSIVVLSGTLSGSTLIVSECCQPPPFNYAHISSSLLPINIWKNSTILTRSTNNEFKIEDEKIYIFADVWFNDQKITKHLITLIGELVVLSTNTPVLIVFIGPFFNPHNPPFNAFFHDFVAYLESVCKNIKFLFIPSTQSNTNAINTMYFMPQGFPIDLKEKLNISNAFYSSNPTRIRIFMAKQLVLFSMLYSAIYFKSSIFPIQTTNTLFLEEIFSSIARQTTLCHFPDSIQPIYYNRACSFSLLPHVDTVVISDICFPCHVSKVDNISFANCGSFSSTCSYLYYTPIKDEFLVIKNLSESIY